MLRKAAELERIIQNCPFSQEEITNAESSGEGESLYVALLLQSPSKEGIEHFDVYHSNDDAYKIVGREIYLLFQHSVRNSKLANNLHRLGGPATVRNWKTMRKLVDLATNMEESMPALH